MQNVFVVLVSLTTIAPYPMALAVTRPPAGCLQPLSKWQTVRCATDTETNEQWRKSFCRASTTHTHTHTHILLCLCVVGVIECAIRVATTTLSSVSVVAIMPRWPRHATS